MLFLFGNLNNQIFLGFINGNNDNNESKNSNSSLILKPPPELALHFNQFNNAIPENNSDPENVMQSKYYDINELQQLKILKNFWRTFENFENFKNFEELRNLLQSTNIKFDVIAITDTQITKNTSVTQKIELSNYSFEHTPTESSSGGTLLYIANHLSYKIRSALNIYKKFELESTFFEKSTPKNQILLLAPSTDIQKWMWLNLTIF